jgi:hypothetical protein
MAEWIGLLALIVVLVAGVVFTVFTRIRPVPDEEDDEEGDDVLGGVVRRPSKHAGPAARAGRFPLVPGDHILVTTNVFRWSHQTGGYEEVRYTEMMRVDTVNTQGVTAVCSHGATGGMLDIPWTAWEMEPSWHRVTYFHPHPDEVLSGKRLYR